jgi:hypothetical protein
MIKLKLHQIAINPALTTCMKVIITRANSTHNKLEVITLTITCDNIVAVAKIKCNPSINNCITINKL